MQEWWIQHGDENFRESLVEEYGQCRAKWLLVSRNGKTSLAIDEILAENYSVVDEKKSVFFPENVVVLYIRKDSDMVHDLGKRNPATIEAPF